LTAETPNGIVHGMTLRQYLALAGLTQHEFGSQIGVSQIAVSRYVNGLRMPRREHLRRIIEATEGAVMPNDFVGANTAPQMPPRQHNS